MKLSVPSDGLLGESALSFLSGLSLDALTAERTVQLSLEQVEEVDVSGIAALVRLYSHLRSRGVSLALTDVSDVVDRQLAEFGFARLFERA